MSQDVEFEGAEVKLGRTMYVVPALGLGAVKKYAKKISEMHTLPLEEQMQLTTEIAHAALKRNYPDMTLERVDELVDLKNMRSVFDAVVQTSGFTAQGPAGGNATGVASQPTGQPSTPT